MHPDSGVDERNLHASEDVLDLLVEASCRNLAGTDAPLVGFIDVAVANVLLAPAGVSSVKESSDASSASSSDCRTRSTDLSDSDEAVLIRELPSLTGVPLLLLTGDSLLLTPGLLSRLSLRAAVRKTEEPGPSLIV